MNRLSPEELISAYLDGELDAGQQREVESWLADHPQAQQLLAELRGLQNLLHTLPQHQMDDDLGQRIRESLRQETLLDAPPLPPPAQPMGIQDGDKEAVLPVTPPPISSAVERYRLSLSQRRRRRWTAAAATACAVSVAGLLLLVSGGRELDEPTAFQQEAPVAGSSGQAEDHSPVEHESDTAPAIDSAAFRAASAEIAQADASRLAPPPQTGPELSVEPAQEETVQWQPPPASASAIPPTVAARRRSELLEAREDTEPSSSRWVRPAATSPFRLGEPVAGDVVIVLDRNRDGVLSDGDVQQSVNILQQLTGARRRNWLGDLLLEQLDRDEDGALSDEEALQAAVAGRLQVPGAGQEVTRLLAMLDRDASGTVNVDELRTLTAQLGAAGAALEPHLVSLVLAVDLNHNQAIDVRESQLAADQIVSLTGLVVPSQTGAPLKAAQQTLARRDRDADGRLSRREVQRDPQLEQLFTTIDVSGDHHITGGELLEHFTRSRPAEPEQETYRFRFRGRR